MTKPLDKKVLLGLIKEVKNFLPEMEKLLVQLSVKGNNKKQIITKLHDLTTTIIGATSIVNLDELTNTATIVNNALSDIIEDKLALNPKLIKVMTETIKNMNKYCLSLETSNNVDDTLYKHTLSAFSKFKKRSNKDLNVKKSNKQKEKSEETFFNEMMEDDDFDDFFEDLDIEIFDEDDTSSDNILEIDDSETIEMEIVEADQPETSQDAVSEKFPTDDDSDILDLEIDDSFIAAIDPELLEIFNEESIDHLEKIAQLLNLLSPSITKQTKLSDEHREMLHHIRRSVHTLKGAAAVIGIKTVASFGHDFEDFLDWLHDEADTLSPDIVAAMLDGTDILEKLSIDPEIKIDKEISKIISIFKAILTDPSNSILEEKQKPKSKDRVEDKPVAEPVDQIIEQPKVQQIKASKTLHTDDNDLKIPDLKTDDTDGIKMADSMTANIDPELLEIFNEESTDHLEMIAKQLNLLSHSILDHTTINDEYREILHHIRRSVHTLKGAAAVIGIKTVASFGHDFEDFLDWLHDEADTLSPDIVAAMLDGTDILEKLSVDPEINIDNEIDKIIQLFKVILTDSSHAVLKEKQKAKLESKDRAEDKPVGKPIEKPVDKPVDESVDQTMEQAKVQQVEASKTLHTDGNDLEIPDPATDDTDGTDGTDGTTDSIKTDDSMAARIDPELLESFNEESTDHLEKINQQLNLLSHSVLDNTTINDEYREILHHIRRSVHTLKGAAAVIGIKSVASFGHDFEDFLDWLHDEADILSPDIVAAMLDGTDILEKLSVDPKINIDNDISKTNSTFKNILTDSSNAVLEKEKKTEPESIKGIADELVDDTADKSVHKPVDEPVDEPAKKTVVEPVYEAVKEQVDKPIKEPVDKPADKPSVKKPIGKPVEELLDTLIDKPIGKAVDKLAGVVIDQPVDQPISKPEIKQVKVSKTLRVGMEKIDQMVGLIGDMTINLSSHEDSSQYFQTTLGEFDNTMKRLKNITLNLEAGFELAAAIPKLNTVKGSTHKEDQASDDFDPLEMDQYSDLNIMIRSLHEAVADLNSIMDQTLNVHNSWQATITRQQRVVNEIQNSMQLIKMAPFANLSNRLHKTVRESARLTEKSVQLIIEGDSMEMDTHVWNLLADPLMHLLRNSVDHGIENPEDRQKLSKPKLATINIKCIRRGSWLNMHISDDGKGLDYEAIRNKAFKLYPTANVSTMDNADLTNLIFKQGFTIKTKATSISGRGVGLDVVNYAVKQLNGSIEVISNKNKGTEFIFRLPIAVAQLPALIVRFGQQEFAVPLRDITRVFRINQNQSTKDSFELDNTILPLLRPAEIMGLEPDPESAEDNPFVLSVDVGSKSGVIVTDAIIGRKDVVFKNLGSHLHNSVPCIAGATILGNGSLLPILNTEELFLEQQASKELVTASDTKTDKIIKSHKILIVDDSISIRKVLTNFINNHGWQPFTAKDGADAVEKIRDDSFDLILLDIEMPRMNGFDVLLFMQSRDAFKDIPVLMLTSRSAKKYRDKATELGANGFITKPFKDDELLSRINDHIKPALSTKKVKTGNL